MTATTDRTLGYGMIIAIIIGYAIVAGVVLGLLSNAYNIPASVRGGFIGGSTGIPGMMLLRKRRKGQAG